MLGAPHPIVPIPAAEVSELRGRRVVVGVPGVGFRGDNRADNVVVRGGRTFIPVLTEQDYYRAELEQMEVFAPLVPIDRVWVEDARPTPRPSSSLALDAPQERRATPAADAAQVLGRRVIQAVADGFVRDLRAISELYVNPTGTLTIRLCVESEWYAWGFAGTAPKPVDVPANGLWIE